MDDNINIREYRIREWPRANITAVEKDRQELARHIFEQLPYISMPSGNFLVWNPTQLCYQDMDKNTFIGIITSMDIIGNNNQLFDSQPRVLNALRSVNNGRVMTADPCWLHLGNTYFNTYSQESQVAHHEWYVPNRIPWEPGQSAETPTIDKLFIDWVGEERYLLLYDILAYTMLRDNFMSVVFAFVGGGANGKSTFLELIRRLLGTENISSSSLVSLSNDKFSKSSFYHKLGVFISETPTLRIDDWMNLKMLCGNDDIEFEYKYGQKFTGKSYAKILICSNGLPVSVDNSDGFYRRWRIVDFPNQFTEQKDVIGTISNDEMRNLVKRCTLIIPRLLTERRFVYEESIPQKRQNYLLASNPFPLFKQECCILDGEEFTSMNDLYVAYSQWLHEQHRRPVEFRVFRDYVMNTDSDIDPRRNSLGRFDAYGIKLRSKHELRHREAQADNMPVVVVQDVVLPLSEEVVQFVRSSCDAGADMVDVGSVLSRFPGLSEKMIEDMVARGDMYHPRPGFLKTT